MEQLPKSPANIPQPKDIEAAQPPAIAATPESITAMGRAIIERTLPASTKVKGVYFA